MIDFSRPETLGLVVVDMQNDFLHPKGAYARGGATSPAIAALPARVKPVADAVRAAGGWVISSHFTLVPGKQGEPFISPHLKTLRPFLRKGDFAPGGFGHALVDELQPTDLSVEKTLLFDPVAPGGLALFDVTITNGGPSDAPDVDFDDAWTGLGTPTIVPAGSQRRSITS